MKICCFYNSNICICGMDGWQPIIKTGNRLQCHNSPH